MGVLKKIIISVLALCVAATILCIGISSIYNGKLIFLAPNYRSMDRFLDKNIKNLSFVSEFLFKFDYDSIIIRREFSPDEEKYEMYVSTNTYHNGHPSGFEDEYKPIPFELVSHIKALYKSGVEVISCDRDSIDFCTWSTMDESRGIEFSRTGEKPDGEQLIEVRQLSKENWYYYVHNFEKAKERNPHLFE